MADDDWLGRIRRRIREIESAPQQSNGARDGIVAVQEVIPFDVVILRRGGNPVTWYYMGDGGAVEVPPEKPRQSQ